MRVPGGYESLRAGRAQLAVRSGLEAFVQDAVARHGSLYGFAAANSTRQLKGRTTAHVIESPAGPLVVRHYVRGGAMAPVLGDFYVRLAGQRPYRELWISSISRSRGIPTPAVAAIGIYPAGPLYRGDIATDLIPDAADLATLSLGPDRRSESERRLAWHAAGRMVEQAAEAGLVHADLNLRNILIAWRAGSPQPWLLDLDRCRIVRRPSRLDLDRMVQRLHRSARKLGGEAGESLQPELNAFVQGLRV